MIIEISSVWNKSLNPWTAYSLPRQSSQTANRENKEHSSILTSLGTFYNNK